MHTIRLMVGLLTAMILMVPNIPVLAETADRQLLQEQIRSILKKNPEIILEALKNSEIELYEIVNRGFGAKRQKAERARWRAQLNNPLKPRIEKNRPIRGYPGAKLTIVEYANFQCSACVSGSNTIKQLIAKYPGKIRLIFKHYTSSPLAQKEATYFEAIARQNPAMAWDFHDQALQKRQQIAEQKEEALKILVNTLAKRYEGFDRNRLLRDLGDKKIATQIQQDVAEAKQFRFSGTPTYIVNGISIHGAAPVAEFEEVISLLVSKDKSLSINVPKAEDCSDCEETPAK